MLLAKRLLTAAGCFFPLVLITFLGVMMILGGIAGAQAGDTGDAAEAGRIAGEQMGEKYGLLALLLSLAFSALVALVISFSGILPWCKRQPVEPPSTPPSLPGQG